MVYKTQVKINGTDRSSLVIEWKKEELEKDFVSDMNLTFYRTPTTQGFQNGESIEVWRGVVTATEEKIFKGFIDDVKKEGEIIVIHGQDELGRLIRREVTKSFDENIDPSAGEISEIFIDLVTNYGGLTADSTSVQSTSSFSLPTITRFICNHADVFERCKFLADLINWRFYYRADTDKVYFEPKGYDDLNTAVFVVDKDVSNTNIVGRPKWKYDYKNAINNVTIIGAKKIVETTELFSGTGAQDTFLLNFLPVSIKVFVGGTLQVGGIESATGTFDYEVDLNPERPSIKFQSGSIPPFGTDNTDVRYGYSVPVPVNDYDQSSIDTYGLYQKTIIIKDIKSVADAIEKARVIINRFSKPFLHGKLSIVGTDRVIINQKIRVVDKINREDRILLIGKKIISYPQGIITYEVGDKLWRMNKWQEDVTQKIRDFEQEEIENQDVLTHVVHLDHISPFNRYRLKIEKQEINDTGIYGHLTPANGSYGTAKYGDRKSAPVVLYDKTY